MSAAYQLPYWELFSNSDDWSEQGGAEATAFACLPRINDECSEGVVDASIMQSCWTWSKADDAALSAHIVARAGVPPSSKLDH